MARLAYDSRLSDVYDFSGRSYTSTHQLSDLTIEVFGLLAKGTSSEELWKRCSRGTDIDLMLAKEGLRLYSEHKLSSADADARKVLASLHKIIDAVVESRTPAASQSWRERATSAIGRLIAERLAAADPGNARWQRDLVVSLSRLGAVARKMGDSAAAVEHAVRCLSSLRAMESRGMFLDPPLLQLLAELRHSVG